MTLAGLIAARYPSPEWAVFFEVANGTGWQAGRHADAVALGIWPSRGNVIIGFECKEYRSDWLREKKNPAKAEAVAAHCDLWYVVVASEAIAKADELPTPWGLLVANADRTKLKIVKEAVQFPDRDKSIIKRTFAAAMLRRVSETMVPKAELQRLVEERLASARQVDSSNDTFEVESLRRELAGLTATLDIFKEQTGVDLRRHDYHGPKDIARAVSAVLRIAHTRDKLKYAADQLNTAADVVESALAAWPRVEPADPTDDEVVEARRVMGLEPVRESVGARG